MRICIFARSVAYKSMQEEMNKSLGHYQCSREQNSAGRMLKGKGRGGCPFTGIELCNATGFQNPRREGSFRIPNSGDVNLLVAAAAPSRVDRTKDTSPMSPLPVTVPHPLRSNVASPYPRYFARAMFSIRI